MPVDDRGLPEMLWHAVGSMAAYDRFTEVVTLVERPLGPDPGADWEQAVAALTSRVAVSAPPPYRLGPPRS